VPVAGARGGLNLLIRREIATRPPALAPEDGHPLPRVSPHGRFGRTFPRVAERLQRLRDEPPARRVARPRRAGAGRRVARAAALRRGALEGLRAVRLAPARRGLAFRSRRMILPERVFGRLSAKRMSSGLAIGPSSSPTHSRSSFVRALVSPLGRSPRSTT